MDYKQMHNMQMSVMMIRNHIQSIIDFNTFTKQNSWDQESKKKYSSDTLNKFQEAIDILDTASKMVNKIDGLIFDEITEETFQLFWEKEFGDEKNLGLNYLNSL